MRIEKDNFGKCKLEDSTLYGIQTVRNIENMSFSGKPLTGYPELIAALAQVKKACALANQRAGVLDKKLAAAICQACDEILEGKYSDQFPVDVLHGGGGIGFNTNFNEVISNVANKKLGQLVGIYDPIHPGKHVNASQSTADVVHTSFRLSIINVYEHLESTLDYLVDELKVKEEEFEAINTVARTSLQDALPVSISSLMEGYNQLLWRRRNKLAQAVGELYKANLGGTAIGTGYGTTESYRENIIDSLCEVTDKEFTIRESLFDAAQNSDDLVEVANELKLLALGLIKVCKDLRLLSSGPNNGFNEITLPKNQEGSIFFTNKNNPVVPEALINCSTQVIGYCHAAETSLNHAELNLNVFETVAAINILDSIVLLAPAIESFVANCIQGIKVNKKTCQNYVKHFQSQPATTSGRK